MRIRKRWPAPSLQPSTPPPESLHHHQPPTDPPLQKASAPRSDLQLTLVKGTNGWICKKDDDCMHSNSSTVRLGEEALPNTNAIGMICTAATAHANRDKSEGISSSASASHLEVESARRSKNSVTTREVVEEDSSDMIRKKRKKVEKDGATMEGLRCSRVNGSGWRCWKQAVAGYSLCAHHSTRGRLRSTTSMKDGKQGHTALSSLPVLLDEEPLIMLNKRRKKKIGMVKNRSISGLLAQTEPEPEPAPSMPILDTQSLLLHQE